MKKYMIDFQMDGQMYSTEIPAESWQDAQKRLEAIQNTGRIEGELVASFPALTQKTWYPNLMLKIIRFFKGD